MILGEGDMWDPGGRGHVGSCVCILCSVVFTVATQPQKLFLPHETHHFVDLFRYGLVALDVYRVTTNLTSGVHVLRSAK